MLLDIIEQETSGLHLSPHQQAEIRRRLSVQRDVVPAEEMEAFFRKLTWRSGSYKRIGHPRLPYITVYVVGDQNIEIIAVFHAAQNKPRGY
jgi:plasmid stabilization system protein ParE